VITRLWKCLLSSLLLIIINVLLIQYFSFFYDYKEIIIKKLYVYKLIKQIPIEYLNVNRVSNILKKNLGTIPNHYNL